MARCSRTSRPSSLPASVSSCCTCPPSTRPSSFWSHGFLTLSLYSFDDVLSHFPLLYVVLLIERAVLLSANLVSVCFVPLFLIFLALALYLGALVELSLGPFRFMLAISNWVPSFKIIHFLSKADYGYSADFAEHFADESVSGTFISLSVFDGFPNAFDVINYCLELSVLLSFGLALCGRGLLKLSFSPFCFSLTISLWVLSLKAISLFAKHFTAGSFVGNYLNFRLTDAFPKPLEAPYFYLKLIVLLSALPMLYFHGTADESVIGTFIKCFVNFFYVGLRPLCSSTTWRPRASTPATAPSCSPSESAAIVQLA